MTTETWQGTPSINFSVRGPKCCHNSFNVPWHCLFKFLELCTKDGVPTKYDLIWGFDDNSEDLDIVPKSQIGIQLGWDLNCDYESHIISIKLFSDLMNVDILGSSNKSSRAHLYHCRRCTSHHGPSPAVCVLQCWDYWQEWNFLSQHKAVWLSEWSTNEDGGGLNQYPHIGQGNS